MSKFSFNFKEIEEPVSTNDPLYDLIHGGYIDPYELLSDEAQASQVSEAIQIIRDFMSQAEDSNAIDLI